MIESKTEAGAQRKGDYDGEDDDWDSLRSYRNVIDMDVYCREEAEMWKKADWKEQIEERQKEDIQEFNTTMKTFNVAQKEVDKFQASLFASGAVTAWVSRSESSAILDNADKFLQVL